MPLTCHHSIVQGITQFDAETAKQREVRQEDFLSGPAGHGAKRPNYPPRASRPFALSVSNSFRTHSPIVSAARQCIRRFALAILVP